jgi:alpha-glucosidase
MIVPYKRISMYHSQLLNRVFLFLSLTLTSMVSAQKLNTSLGNLVDFKKTESGIEGKTSFGDFKVIVYNSSVFRIRLAQNNGFDNITYGAIAEPVKNTKFTIQDTEKSITISTDSITLIIQKSPVRYSFFNKKNQLLNEDDPSFGTSWIGDQVTTYKKLQKDEKFIGLGEKTGNLNRRGEGYTNWNTDFYAYPANADPIYLTIPFYLGIHGGTQYGIFMDNPYKSHFNFGASTDRFSSFTAEDGEMNYYFFGGSAVSKIIEDYSWLTGRMEMPPLWSLGYQQCRWSYYPDQEVLRIAKTFREKLIPADVIYLDIHYMDAYKIFTWHPVRFPEPRKMLSELKSLGFHTTVIVDPGIKVEKGYKSYEEGIKENLFLKYPDQSNYTGQVWPGWCHFPDFTNPQAREWWGNSFKGYVEDGIDGFWNDMNEPATWGQRFPDLVEFDFEGQKGTHKKGHNIYGMNMARATFEGTRKLLNGRRPFVLTRAGYSGVQRYSAVWTGDNQANDEHMMAGVRLLNSMGLSGIPFVGMDIGGFTGNPSKELFARWISIGALTPFCRAHVSAGNKDQEPWSFGEQVEEISRNYIQLRYNLMPYIYSKFYESSQNGMPVMRSLAINYTHDPKIYDWKYQNQYFFGDALLIAPSESNKDLTRVYLPEKDFYDFYNDKYYSGSEEIIASSPIDRLPVFVRGGSIIPMQSPVQNLSEKPNDTLFIHVYNGKANNSFLYYEDDGDTYQFKSGSFYSRMIRFNPAKRSIDLDPVQGSYASKFKILKVIFHGFSELKKELIVDGNKQVLKSEKITHIKPYLKYDYNQAIAGEMMNVFSVTIRNVQEKVTINY